MTFLKMLITAMGQVLTWCGGHQARQFMELHLRKTGYNDDVIAAAREAVTLMVAALVTALMTRIFQLMDAP
ncbi:hypothetical protein RI049_18190 [Cedecea neteri]|uniref:hypothetical protein n=1 Tax=Cedecea neteri TaxID=158822 RepID=UPI002AA7937E|nr:hypothetical protein [Cedecea neteri]WPU21961.1 hypothetical protein RI049_18190 [Cedecea neteri]